MPLGGDGGKLLNDRHGGSPDRNTDKVRKFPYRVNVRFALGLFRSWGERRGLRQTPSGAEEMLNSHATVLAGALLWPGKGRGLSCVCVPITAKFTHRIKKIMADV